MPSLDVLKRRMAERFAPPPWAKDLTEKQKRVYNEPARFKRALAGRQSGKSHTCAAWLLGGQRGEVSLAFARTADQVRGIYLEPFHELNERYKLGLRIYSSGQNLKVVERSGAVIKLAGIRDESSAERFRGQRFRRVVADEMGTYKHELIRTIIQSVLQPTLLKKGGRLMAVGTPGVIPEGFWYELCHGKTEPDGRVVKPWPTDFGPEGWTLYDNPYLPDVETFIADLLRDNGWTRDTPVFAREYLAKWVRDAGGLCYQWPGVFANEWPSTGTTILGIDIGYDDGCGFVVIRMAQRPKVYVLRAFSTTHSLPHEIVDVARGLIERFNVNHVVADTAGSGKGIVELLAQNFKLGSGGSMVESAKKIGEQNKRANIDFIRGAMQVGNLYLCPPHDGHDGALELKQEWSVLPWNEDRSGHCEGFQDELSDALIYAMKLFLQTAGPSAGPAPPDPAELERARRRRDAEQRARKNTRQRWRASDGGLWVPDHGWEIAA
jgi:hypothetical protein